MKRAAFLLFVILSFYVAGLYRYPPLLVLSMTALLSLLLLFLYSLDGVRMSALAVFSLAGLLGGALWLSWNRRKGTFYLLLFILLPAGVLYVYLLRDTLRRQLGGRMRK